MRSIRPNNCLNPLFAMLSSCKIRIVVLPLLLNLLPVTNGAEPASETRRVGKPSPKLFHFATNESIQKIVACSSEQQQAMQKLKSKLETEIESVKGEAVSLSRDGVSNLLIRHYVELEMIRVSDTADQWVDEVLYREQGDRLKAIYLARKGTRCFGERWLQEELDLTRKQTNLISMEMLRLSDAVKKERRPTTLEDGWKTALAALDREAQTRIENILSTEQQARINEIRTSLTTEHATK